ncbi:maltose acetyltransferase [Brachionus plicatilis]|uniref:Maltose acetyltransferase n=1 Tax=Brachionus plicatilis TaxID=10195 RepID=A0A3M7SK16_BRAPC|nr:maltose acetyltransferase [Brachionus plicatilis]
MDSDIIEPKKLQIPSRESLKNKDPSEYNEVEKMQASMLYNAMDDTLIKGRGFAKVMCKKINEACPLRMEQRNEMFKELFGKYSPGCYIEPPFYCDYGSNIHLDDFVYMNHGCVLLDINEIRIGKGTFLAPNVHLYTAGHPVDPIKRRTQEFGKPIQIGRDCWIGGNVIILPGITIGDGVTIGAGSVVTKDIDSFSVVVGNPARVIRKLEEVDLNKE